MVTLPLKLLGDNLGQRHRYLNSQVNLAIAAGQDCFQDIEALSEQTAVDRLFKIDVANRVKNVEYILKNLRDDDLLYVSRALKCKWLVKRRDLINPHYLEDVLFPQMVMPAITKMKHWLYINLTDPLTSEEFYLYYKSRNFYFAVKFLRHCNIEFLLNEFPKILIQINPHDLKVLGEKYPKLVKIYFESLVTDNELVKVYLEHEAAFYNNYLSWWFSYANVEPLVKRINRNSRAAFKKRVFVEKDVGERVNEWPYSLPSSPVIDDANCDNLHVFDDLDFEPIQLSRNRKMMKRIVKKKKGLASEYVVISDCSSKSDLQKLFDEFRFVGFDGTLYELKGRLGAATSADRRRDMLLVLVSKTGGHAKNVESLLRLALRLRNEPVHERAAIVRSLVKRARAWCLPNDVWNMMLEYASGLGLDGTPSEAQCREGLHAVVLRQLLTAGECESAVRSAFLDDFSTLEEYKLTANERLEVALGLQHILLSAASDAKPIEAARHLNNLLDMLERYQLPFKAVVSAVAELAYRDWEVACSLLMRLYDARVGRRELILSANVRHSLSIQCLFKEMALILPTTLSGDSLGERHRRLNLQVNQAATAGQVSAQDIEGLTEQTAVNRLIKIDIAIKLKNIDYIVKSLKDDDMLYVSRALKCKWLLERRDIVNPNYLEDVLYPQMVLPAISKFKHWLYINLSDSVACQEFYEYYKNIKFDFAVKFLRHCDNEFLLKEFPKVLTQINPHYLKVLGEKCSKLVKIYYDSFSSDNELVKSRAAFKKRVFVEKDIGEPVAEWPYALPTLPVVNDSSTIDSHVFHDQDYEPIQLGNNFGFRRMLKKRKYCSYMEADCLQSECIRVKSELQKLFDEFRIVGFNGTLHELRGRINAVSSADRRRDILLVLVSKSGGRPECVRLIMELALRFRNEPVHQRATIVRSLVKRASAWRLPQDVWDSMLEYGQGLGLDGTRSEAQCREGLHAVVLRQLLTTRDCVGAVRTAFLRDFSTLEEYKLTTAERSTIAAGLQHILTSAARDAKPEVSASYLDRLLYVFEKYRIPFNSVVADIKTLADRDSEVARSLLQRLYKARVGRPKMALIPPTTLPGDSLGERHRRLNLQVNQAATAGQVSAKDIEGLTEQTAVDRLIKIDIAIKLKNVDYIVKSLKDDDMLYVSRALKCKWLLERHDIVNPNYLEDMLYPQMVLPAISKFKHWLYINLSDPVACQEFYEYYKNIKFDFAVKFLRHCDNEFLLKEFPKVLTQINPHYLKVLGEKCPKLVKIYYDSFSSDNELVKRAAFKKRVFVKKDVGQRVAEWPYALPESPVVKDLGTTESHVFDDQDYEPIETNWYIGYERMSMVMKCCDHSVVMCDSMESDDVNHRTKSELEKLFDEFRFVGFNGTLHELRGRINAVSSADRRRDMLLVLVSKSGGRPDCVREMLQFALRFRNEPVHERATIVRSLVKRANVWRLPQDVWDSMLEYGQGLGLDGTRSEAQCREGLHAVVVRQLLTTGDCVGAVRSAFLEDFSTLEEYKLNTAERATIADGLQNILTSAASDAKSEVSASYLDRLLDVFEKYRIPFNSVVAHIKTLADRDSEVATSLLQRLYKARVGRPIVIRYLMLSESDDEEKSRFEQIGQPFLEKITSFRQGDDEFREFTRLYYMNIDKIIFSSNHTSSNSTLRRTKMALILPTTLSGDSLGERHRRLNLQVNEAATAGQVSAQDIEALTEQTAVDRLIKIDIAIKLKNVDYIVKSLKDDDMLYVSRALKCKWLLERRDIVNPNYLEDVLYPQMVLPAISKFKHWLYINLSDPVTCQEFYEYYKNIKFDFAVKFLRHCDNEFLLKEIPKILTQINPHYLKVLGEKCPKLVKIYYDSFSSDNELVKRAAFKKRVFVKKDVGERVAEWPYALPALPVVKDLGTNESHVFHDQDYEPIQLKWYLGYGRMAMRNKCCAYTAGMCALRESDYINHRMKSELEKLFDEFRFVGFNGTLHELRGRINAVSSADRRRDMLLVLVSKSGGRPDCVREMLQFALRFRNEPVHERAAIVRSLVKRANVWRLPQDVWDSMLEYGQGLGLDGTRSEAQCREGLHAVVLRQLLTTGDCVGAVRSAFLEDFSTLEEYKLNTAERAKIADGLQHILTSAARDAKPEVSASYLDRLLYVFEKYRIPFNSVVADIKTLADRDSEVARSLLQRLYKARVGRPIVIRYLMLSESDEEETSRFEQIGQPFLEKITAFRQGDDDFRNYK
ncbi:unnamed protein product [Arctia plantaginis]|uniref:Uncharacterized protein n=1 Tax=Arctia plantaginis TaxID=874455 RepID=A0A8S1AIW4_ARCPL|nr:unnamed protein product [Arctia plantaginis]